MGDRPRYSHRRPRYYDDDESDTSEVDNYPPPRPKAHPDDRRPPPPPAQAPPPPAQPTSDDEGDKYAPRSRRAPAAPRHDLEAKTGDEHRKFRAKRDGYESDEGENLKQARRAPPAARGYPDDDGYAKPRRQELPVREKPRAVEYGGEAVPAGDAPIRRRRTLPSSKSNMLRGIVQALAGSSPTASRGVGSFRDLAFLLIHSYTNTPPTGTYKDPPSRRRDYDDYDDAPSPRRPERRRTEYDDPGYRSDNARRRPQQPRPRPRRDYDDYDYERPRRRDADDGYRSGGDRPQRPRPHDYFSDYREDRAPRRGDPRRDPRDDRDRYDDRRRDRDPYGPPRPRDRDRGGDKRRSNGGGMKDWQKEAGAAFMTYAMPTIKKEGTRFVKKELQKFLAGRGAGGV